MTSTGIQDSLTYIPVADMPELIKGLVILRKRPHSLHAHRKISDVSQLNIFNFWSDLERPAMLEQSNDSVLHINNYNY